MCAGIVYAQPGSIFDPAVPAINPMDPNGDGFITSTNAAFTGPLDATEFELPFLPFQPYEAEPGNDNQNAEGCRFYELVDDQASGAAAGYYYYSDPDGVPDNGDEIMVFRLRVGAYATSSSAFSILIDTDYRFGFSGPEADPNAIIGNPGFEREITVYTNTGATGGVRVWNVDGRLQGQTAAFHGSTASHYQVAYALNQHPDCSEQPVFVDFYIPFSALGIPVSTQVRMAVAANDNVGPSLGGDASDIGGVNGNTLTNDDDQFVALVGNFSPLDLDNPSNIVPRAQDAAVSIYENEGAGTPVFTVSANDPNGDALSFSISSGNTGSTFSINSTSGLISVNDGLLLDFEEGTVFILVIKVSDGRLYDNAIITVGLLNVNESPSATDATVWVDEHTAEGASVYTVQAIDPDADTQLEYTLTAGNVNEVFYLDPATGELHVNSSSLLDFETTPVFTLSGIVSDGFLQDDFTLEVRLNDVNEPPSVTGGEFFVYENTVQGVTVGMVTGSDPDAGNLLTYSIIDGNTGDAFLINSASGEILVNQSAALNFETHPVFTLTVMVDDGALSGYNTVVITLNDLNEAPFIDDAVITVNDLLWSGDLLTTIIGSDPDAGDVLSYALESGNEELIFSFDPATGSLSVLDPLALFESYRTFPLIFSATDREGLKATGTITIDVRRIPGRDDIRPTKGFSPNGDGTNDFWLIAGIEAFPENMIHVFNRWGLAVFEMRGYDNGRNAWRGDVNGTVAVVETTYFYVIRAGDFDPITGYLILKP